MTACAACARLRVFGRGDHDPIHCRACHQSWTGVEAQHCVRCHRTFTKIGPADAHRQADVCLDPATTPGWREVRPGVWTNAAPMTDNERQRARHVAHTDANPLEH